MSISRLLFALVVTLTLAACGGGDSATVVAPPVAQKTCDNTLAPTDPAYDPTCGDVLVEITDADGDILSYAVDVVSLSLTRADGVQVELLPNRTRIDFAQYVDLTELFTAARLPPGVYTAASLTLDYAAAEVVVEQGGAPVTATVQLPGAGSEASITVRFATGHPLVVAPGLPALITLDFDLLASHTVDLVAVPPTVTLSTPVLTATLNRDLDDRARRVRGPLLGVDLENARYAVALRPVYRRDGHFGRLPVQTTPTTEFELDGAAYTGSAGITAMAALTQGTATVALGRYDHVMRIYVAERVLAGSSVPGGTLDAAIGSVRARSGDSFTVHGGILLRADGDFRFVEAISIALDADTVVRKVGALAPVGPEQISVASRVEVLGTATVDPGTGAVAVSADLVRILPSVVTGTVVEVAGGTLVADLQTVNRRRVGLHDFAGTGIDAANDADPEAYEIALGLLTGGSLDAGDPIGVQGFVRAFGSAPADYDAITLADYSSARAKVVVGWGESGSLAPFSALGAEGLIVDLADPALGAMHHLFRGPVVTDLNDLPASPTIVPAAEPIGFAIRRGGMVASYASFADWSAALSAAFTAGAPLKGLFVRGTFDGDANQLAASGAVAIFD
jgi:hypothetical protein